MACSGGAMRSPSALTTSTRSPEMSGARSSGVCTDIESRSMASVMPSRSARARSGRPSPWLHNKSGNDATGIIGAASASGATVA